jgi:hypothetical protein
MLWGHLVSDHSSVHAQVRRVEGHAACVPSDRRITDLKDPFWDAFRIRISPSIVVFRDGLPQARIDGRRFIGITRGALARLEGELAPT